MMTPFLPMTGIMGAMGGAGGFGKMYAANLLSQAMADPDSEFCPDKWLANPVQIQQPHRAFLPVYLISVYFLHKV